MSAPTLLDLHDALLLDLDGVVYVGPDAVPHAVAALRAARTAGLATAFVTNNAARPPAVVAEHLRSFGLDVADTDVVTSAQAAAREVAARSPSGSRVLAIGGPGVALALEARGLVPVSLAAESPVAVVMGYGPDVSWRHLAEASFALGNGAVLVATNTDTSIPLPQGIAPGNGALVGAVVAATGISPILVAGKPFEPLVRESVERVGARRPLMVGDRLDTDIEGAVRADLASLLVLTGVHGVTDLVTARPERRPTYVAADLRGLEAPAAWLDLRAPEDGDRLAPLRLAARRAWDDADAGRATAPVDVEALAGLVAQALAEPA